MMIFCHMTPRVHSQLLFNCIFCDPFMYCPSSVIAQIGLRPLDCIKTNELSFDIRKELNTLLFLFIYPKLTAFKSPQICQLFPWRSTKTLRKAFFNFSSMPLFLTIFLSWRFRFILIFYLFLLFPP